MMMRNTIPFLAMMAMGVSLVSCLKSKSNNNQNNPAQVAFINVSPSMPSFSVLLDGVTKGTNATFPYMGYQVASGSTDSALSYTSVFAGIHYIAFQDSVVDTSDFASGNIQFANATKYSIYLFDTINNFGLNAVQIQDSYDSIPLAVPTSAIRFLNFCGDSTGIDVIYNDTTLWYANALFIGLNGSSSPTTLSQYTNLPAGRYVFNFFHYGYENFIPNSSGSTLINQPTTSPFDSIAIITQPQKAYTIIVSGFYDSLPPNPKAFKHAIIHMN